MKYLLLTGLILFSFNSAIASTECNTSIDYVISVAQSEGMSQIVVTHTMGKIKKIEVILEGFEKYPHMEYLQGFSKIEAEKELEIFEQELVEEVATLKESTALLNKMREKVKTLCK